MIIIYNKAKLKIVSTVASNETIEEVIEKDAIRNFGGKIDDYASIELTVEEVAKTSTHEFTIVNGQIVFGDEKVIEEPPKEPSEVELLNDYVVDVDYRVTMIELGLN
ncbi:hypothetical protein KDN24_12810 [Bacillus sp. Bva_UNVM-123]|uniref:hypothetical protein n=1 Tax=Bacillus sp. Bva_UNVM-123 TaxID=2829798 RepID=UPI00391F24BE